MLAAIALTGVGRAPTLYGSGHCGALYWPTQCREDAASDALCFACPN